MKKLNFSRVIIALALMLTGTLPSFAHDFYVNGIYYNITSDTDKTVEVTDSYTIEYPGSVVIPSSVTYNGTTYSVTSIGDMVFSGCTGLTSVTIPNSVTTIGDHAFYVCTGLKEVTIGNSVTSIGDNAFYDCPSLTEVNIYDLSAWCKIDFGGYCANPLDYARGHLKLNGTEITNLVIPDDITEIKACAFSGCTGLISVTIPNSVTSIGASAFSYCTGLTSVTIPNSVTDIGHSAFEGCRNLAELIIEDGKETLSLGSSYINSGNGVGIGLFSYCLLKKLYLGRNLDYDTSKSYGYSPFYNISTLEEITIGNSVTTIGDYAFYCCTGLKEVTIGNSVTSIGDYAFSACYMRSVIIPNSVTSIGDYAFYDCSMRSVIIPNSVTSIGQKAFYDCYNLTSVTIGKSVTTIGDGAFYDCPNLKFVINLSNLTFSIRSTGYGYIAYNAYQVINVPNYGYIDGDFVWAEKDNVNTLVTYLGNATELILPMDLNGENYNIGNYAFYGCRGLTSVTIPNSVTSIGNYAFNLCANLAELIIEDGNETLSLGYNYNHYDYYDVGQGLFYDCPLEKLYLGRNLDYDTRKSYGYSPFYKISTLKEITIGNSVTTIGDYAFYVCTGLKEVTIGNSVTSIGTSAFKGCTDLATVYYNAENCTSMGSSSYPVFSGCTNLATLNIGNNVTNIPHYAFSGCTGLTSVTIGNSVTSIGGSAFSGCTGLTSVTIGNSVTSIGGSAFKGCTDLATVYYNAENCTSIGSSVFDGCTNLETINIGNSVKTIPSYAFSSCTSLTEINISDLSAWCKIDFADKYANPLYYAGHLKLNGTEITNLVIPDDIYQIKRYTFVNCTGLTAVTIPNSVTYIGISAFYGCTGLTSVYISDLSAWCKIDFAYEYANPLHYAGHLKLNGTEITNLVIPNNITEIKGYAFCGCTGLTSITIPNSVTEIGDNAFIYCTGLTEVNISDISAWCKIDFYNSIANPLDYARHLKLNGTEITNLVIPDDITKIKAYAFYGCTGLKEVTIPNSVTEIGYQTFYGCTGLTSITIPNSVTFIDYGAFSSSGLRLIFSYCMTPPTCGDGAFYGCYDARLMVPEGTYYDYLVANEWYKFDKIQEIAGIEGVEVDNNAVEIARYDIYGRQLTEPTKGINIIKMSDGTKRKEYVK